MIASASGGMAEVASSSAGAMAENDIIAMKETLRAQQQLLQKLYAELDEEREASATAAKEALDMILRLQGEKAAVKMEACQYERMAEERLEHAQTTLEIFEELMFQKDMEIASLEFQVQAYKRKLVSLGCDPHICELEASENNQLGERNNDEHHQNNDEIHHGQIQNGTVRRLSSLPPIPTNNKNNFRGGPRKRERSPSPLPISMPPRRVDDKGEQECYSQGLDLAKKSVDSSTHESMDSLWGQIRKLDEKVKEISDCKDKDGEISPKLRGRRYRSCSLYSRGKSKTPEIRLAREASIADPSFSGNVHDVFEVPQTRENHRVSENGKHSVERMMSLMAESRLTKPDPEVPEERGESLHRYDSSKLMKILSNIESRAHSPRNFSNNHHNNSIISCMFDHKKEGMSVECNGQAEFHMLSKRIENLERERERERETVYTRQEITHETDGEEQMKLLKEILSQINTIKKEMASSKTKKAPPKNDDVSLGPLQEVRYM